MNLKFIPWIEAAAAKQNPWLALIPIGAIEPYGPHSPLGTDGIAVEETARLISERIPAVVTPLIPVGCSRVFEEYPGCLTVTAEALTAYLHGISTSLLQHGCRGILFLDGHAGNVAPISGLMETLQDAYPEVHFAQIDFWRYVGPVAHRIFPNTENPLGHAGETMTSVMLYLMPNTLRMDNITDVVSSKRTVIPGLTRPIKLNPETDLTVRGDPFGASEEKGRQIIEETVASLIELISPWTKE